VSSTATLRSQIEAALADRIPSALTPAAKTIREVMPTGITAIDALLDGGLSVGAVTEMIGTERSGRTALALSFVAQVTRAERVCAWIDVSNALSPGVGGCVGSREPYRFSILYGFIIGYFDWLHTHSDCWQNESCQSDPRDRALVQRWRAASTERMNALTACPAKVRVKLNAFP
jgi:RecA/RadA recombinase